MHGWSESSDYFLEQKGPELDRINNVLDFKLLLSKSKGGGGGGGAPLPWIQP